MQYRHGVGHDRRASRQIVELNDDHPVGRAGLLEPEVQPRAVAVVVVLAVEVSSAQRAASVELLLDDPRHCAYQQALEFRLRALLTKKRAVANLAKGKYLDGGDRFGKLQHHNSGSPVPHRACTTHAHQGSRNEGVTLVSRDMIPSDDQSAKHLCSFEGETWAFSRFRRNTRCCDLRQRATTTMLAASIDRPLPAETTCRRTSSRPPLRGEAAGRIARSPPAPRMAARARRSRFRKA